MKHKHAELMLQYAQDAMTTDTPWELWEYKDTYKNGQWLTLNSNPAWYPTDEYRRKPRTIKINGVDVPEPCREMLEEGTEYWVPLIGSSSLAAMYGWEGCSRDERILPRGLIHLTREDAEAHAKALLSFTSLEGDQP